MLTRLFAGLRRQTEIFVFLLAGGVSFIAGWGVVLKPQYINQVERRAVADDLETSDSDRTAGATIEDLKNERLSSKELRGVVESVEVNELGVILKNLPAEFWRENANSEIVLCLALARLRDWSFEDKLSIAIASAGMAGGGRGKSKLHLNAAFRGIFSTALPATKDVATAIETLDEADALSLIEEYLAFAERGSDLVRVCDELSANRSWTKESASKLASLVLNQELRGSVSLGTSLKELLKMGDVLKSSSDAFARSVALRPREAAESLAEASSRNPKGAGALAAAAGIPMELLPSMLGAMKDKDQQGFLKGFCSHLNQHAARDMGRFAREVPAGELPNESIGYLTAGIIRNSPDELETWLSRLDDGSRTSALDASVHETRKLDSPARPLSSHAAETFLRVRLPLGDLSSKPILVALGGVARENANEALRIAEALPPDLQDEAKSEIYKTCGWSFRTRNPEEISAIISLIPEDARRTAFKTYSETLQFSGGEKALEVLQLLSRDEDRADLASAMLANGASNIPIGVRKELTQTLLRDGGAPSEAILAVDSLMRDLGQVNAREAIEFIGNVSDDGVRDSAIVSLSKSWVSADPVAAAEWIDTLRGGHARDDALVELTKASVDDPERALANVKAIESQEKRLTAAVMIVNLWFSMDPVVGQRLLENSSFTPQEQLEISSKITYPKEDSERIKINSIR